MTLSFRLLLDMHKCQSDYNAGSASPRPRPSLPATCLSFCHMPQCIQGPKKDSELLAVSCECDNAHSVAYSLLTRPSSTTRRNSTAGRSRRSCHWELGLELVHRLAVRRCAYCRSVALRLRASRKSRQQIKAKCRVALFPHPLSPRFTTSSFILSCCRSLLGHK